jgi:hypothetical protein
VSIETSQRSQVQAQQNEYQARLLEAIVRQLSGFGTQQDERIEPSNLIQVLGNGVTASAHVEQLCTVRSQQTTTPSSNVVRTTNTTETTVSSFKLEFSRFQKKSCSRLCSCACHYRSRYRSPLIATQILGSLFIGLSSLPFVAPRCTETSCTQRSPFSATFTYQFPSWLIARVVSLIFITTAAGDPAACVKIRHVNRDFKIFRMASIGDVTGIQSLLKQKLAHPSATYFGGWTPLHVGTLLLRINTIFTHTFSMPSLTVTLQCVSCCLARVQIHSLKTVVINCMPLPHQCPQTCTDIEYQKVCS